MFQLYKKRNFNSLINDTFIFFKASGKNYFKNYFIINGGLLLILAALMFVFGRVFFESMFSGITGSERDIEGYFQENFTLMLTLGILAGILIIIASLLNYCYPIVYLMLLEKNEKPDAKQIFSVLKFKIWKAILFGLCFLFTFLPLAAVVGLFSFLLIVIIIGIPVFIIIFAAFTCWIYLSFYDYISTDNGYFTSMGNGWNMLFKNFWAHMGSTAIFYVILYVSQGVIMLAGLIINAITSIVSIGPDADAADPASVMSAVTVTMIIGFIIQTVVSFIMGNFIFINQGVIYYSCREEEENHTLKNDIDLIGTDFE